MIDLQFLPLLLAVGMAYSLFDPGCCPCACDFCTRRPRQIQLIVTGVTANTCAGCPTVNGTWLLDDCCASVYIDPGSPEDGQLDPLPDGSCCGHTTDGPCHWFTDGPDLCGDATRWEFTRGCQAGTNAYTLAAVLRNVETCATLAAWTKTGPNNTCDDECQWSTVMLTQAGTVGPCTITASTCALSSL